MSLHFFIPAIPPPRCFLYSGGSRAKLGVSALSFRLGWGRWRTDSWLKTASEEARQVLGASAGRSLDGSSDGEGGGGGPSANATTATWVAAQAHSVGDGKAAAEAKPKKRNAFTRAEEEVELEEAEIEREEAMEATAIARAEARKKQEAQKVSTWGQAVRCKL